MTAMAHFEALQFHQMGNPADVLQFDKLEACELADDEVRIEVEAFALNRADWLFAEGSHYSIPALPSRIGSECAGKVIQAGIAVDQNLIGKRICSVPFDNCRFGVQGEFVDLPARYVAPWPEQLTAEEASATWMQYLTAYFALNLVANVQSDDFVLIPAASSSAGLAAIQFAKRKGATVLASSRSPEKEKALTTAGADHVLISTGMTDLTDEILDVSKGRGVRIVYDPVGGDFSSRYGNALAQNAEVFLYGQLSGQTNVIDLLPFIRANATVRPYSMFNHVSNTASLNQAINHIVAEIRDGLRPIIDKIFDWRLALDAYRYVDAGEHVGKVVVSLRKAI